MAHSWSMFDISVEGMMLRHGLTKEQAVAQARMWMERSLDGVPLEKREDFRKTMTRPNPKITDEVAKQLIADMLTVPQDSVESYLGMEKGSLNAKPEARDWRRYATSLNEQSEISAREAGAPMQGYSREDCWRVGKFFFDHTIGLAADPSRDDAWDDGLKKAYEILPRDMAEKIWATCNSQDSSGFTTATTRWYEQGCPVVQISSHSYGSALGGTSIPGNADVRPPWRSFMIDLPNGTIPADGGGDIRSLLVHYYTSPSSPEPRWTVLLLPRNPGTPLLRTEGRTLKELADGDLDRDDGSETLPTVINMDVTSEDERQLRVCSRIAISTCLAMSDPTAVRATVSAKLSRVIQQKRLQSEPACRVFLLGRPVKIDVSEAIRSYVLHGSRGSGPITVQFMVRGHWRDQACGPNMTEHRRIWIEPHWKGPADAPINLRPHVLEKTDS